MQVLKEEIKNKILDVAENIFYQKGFRDTTTRSIASEVGISVSNLYLYYKNKEAIFYEITDGFYKYCINCVETFFRHDDNDKRMDVVISSLIRKIMITDRKRFVIICNRSEGTKYGGFKQQIVSILNNHMEMQVNKDLIKDPLILTILAKNFIEGIIELAENYKGEDWLENSISTLVNYHMKGMEQFM
ncbi:TetR/AcrR family transcriptional regulator [Clostridium sp. DJ247]|uniref:TetR/AcrR family transcriptional regulator n=1 Tax=Clostridium sp. DJ247 TaxID=2726188 RepID=UPI0016269384|nr:TetR/AcrR family transcriptional regulator [Clostridium sp. DJ247]MBC2580383.1 TetR/AcrR family transcriptional regulator [Clostridium sp. DJ247]